MLVQKSGLNKRTKILLIIFCALLIPAGYFAYSSFLAKPAPTTSVVNQGPVLTESVVVTPLNDQLLNDAQLKSFAGIDVPGFAEQYEGIYLDSETPLPPELITVTDPGTGSRLIVGWTLPTQRNFSSVAVYRSDSAGTRGERVYTSSVSDTSSVMNFEDKDLQNQRTYYYLVVTANTDGKESANVRQFAGTPTDTFPPSAPLAVSIKNLSDDQVEISWLVPPDPDFSTVRIYRSNQQGILGSIIDADIRDDQGNRQFAVDTVTANITYYYTVTSVDASGNESSTDVLAAPYRANPFQPSSY